MKHHDGLSWGYIIMIDHADVSSRCVITMYNDNTSSMIHNESSWYIITTSEHRTRHNTARTPNTKHIQTQPKHVQKRNTEQNNAHKHAPSEPQTLFIPTPHFKAGSEKGHGCNIKQHQQLPTHNSWVTRLWLLNPEVAFFTCSLSFLCVQTRRYQKRHKGINPCGKSLPSIYWVVTLHKGYCRRWCISMYTIYSVDHPSLNKITHNSMQWCCRSNP